MKRIYSDLASIRPRQRFRGEYELARARDLLLTPFAMRVAACLGCPGVPVREDLIAGFARALVARRLPWRLGLELIRDTFDSVRYFELGFAAAHAPSGTPRALDMSSPRALGLWLLLVGQADHVTFCNPHAPDLALTRVLVGSLGVADRCELSSSDSRSLPGGPGAFDLVTSISVVEHIPAGEDTEAIANMWSRLRPGGRLILSVPVASEALEEYTDFNEYGRELERDRQYTLGQRFYDEALLAERVFSITGDPTVAEVYGEREPDTFFRRRGWRLSSFSYPFWAEPLHMARRYRTFSSVSSLPGLGVAAMAFDKP